MDADGIRIQKEMESHRINGPNDSQEVYTCFMNGLDETSAEDRENWRAMFK